MPKQSKKELRRLAREQKKLEKLRKKDPFYLAMQQVREEPSVEDIPIQKLDDTIDIDLSHMEPEEKGKKKKKKKKGKGGEDPEPEPESPPHFTVKAVADEPEGDEVAEVGKDMLDIDINAPLRVDEVLPEMKGYGRQTADQFLDLDDPHTESRNLAEETSELAKGGVALSSSHHAHLLVRKRIATSLRMTNDSLRVAARKTALAVSGAGCI